VVFDFEKTAVIVQSESLEYIVGNTSEKAGSKRKNARLTESCGSNVCLETEMPMECFCGGSFFNDRRA
jgi:hypothetical protein